VIRIRIAFWGGGAGDTWLLPIIRQSFVSPKALGVTSSLV
jgi:hypothetical protein